MTFELYFTRVQRSSRTIIPYARRGAWGRGYNNPTTLVTTSLLITVSDHYTVVIIGYSPAPCRTNEGVQALRVDVDVLFGELARNLSIQFNTIGDTALGKVLK